MSGTEGRPAHPVSASMQSTEAAQLRFLAAIAQTDAAFREFTAAAVASEAREIAEHPDLAELNVQVDGLYEAPGGAQ